MCWFLLHIDSHALICISATRALPRPCLTRTVAILDPPVGRPAKWVDMGMEDTLAPEAMGLQTAVPQVEAIEARHRIRSE